MERSEIEKLPRAHRRQLERIEKEAHETNQKLVMRFYEFFMDNDPEGEEVKAKLSEVDAKWRLYCKQRKLDPKALPLVQDSCNELLSQYVSIKNNTETVTPK